MLWLILFFGALGLGFLGTFGLIAVSYWHRLMDFRELVTQGVATEATVERKYGRHRVVITYRDAGGQLHRHDRTLLPGEFHQLREGGTIPIIYSAQRPHVWAFAETIRQARRLQG